MNILDYIINQIVPQKDISNITEIIELTEEETINLLKLISIVEKEIYDKNAEITNLQKEIEFGNDALIAYKRISYNILSMYTGMKKDFNVYIYELDYLLSAVEIGKDIMSETGKETVPTNVLDSLFVKIYDKYRKYKREIMEYFTLYDEKERVKILKNMHEKRD